MRRLTYGIKNPFICRKQKLNWHWHKREWELEVGEKAIGTLAAIVTQHHFYKAGSFLPHCFTHFFMLFILAWHLLLTKWLLSFKYFLSVFQVRMRKPARMTLVSVCVYVSGCLSNAFRRFRGHFWQISANWASGSMQGFKDEVLLSPCGTRDDLGYSSPWGL